MKRYLLAILIVASATFFSACTTMQDSSATVWEYKILDGRISTSQEKGRVEESLNGLADEGWIVSSSSAASTSRGTQENIFIILKRPRK